MIPTPPNGWRLVTQSEKDAIRGQSGYLSSYPKILHRVRAHDEEYGWKEEGHYRYFWDDIHYAIPDDSSQGTVAQRLEGKLE